MPNETLTAEMTPITDRERRLMDVIEQNNARIAELNKELHECRAYCDLLLDRMEQTTAALKAEMLDALREIGNDDFDKEVLAHALIGFDYLLIRRAMKEAPDA